MGKIEIDINYDEESYYICSDSVDHWEDEDCPPILCNVDDGTLARWRKAIRDYEQVQGEMKRVYDDERIE